MAAVKLIRANSYLLAHDYILQMFKSAEQGVSVVRYVLEGDTPDQDAVEFEMRVTKIGNTRIRPTYVPAKKA